MTHRMLLCFLVSLSVCIRNAIGAEATAPTNGDDWVNITDKPPAPFRHSQGIAVDPTTGNLYLYIRGALSISKDQGETWSALRCPITGPSETGFSFNLAYPFTGRMALFTHDGINGMTLDGGATWHPFAAFKREFDFGDLDWELT